MTYKNIVVHVDSSERCGARIDYAAQLAQRFDAHLIGLYTLIPFEVPGYIRAHIGEDVSREQAARARKDAEAALDRFSERVRRGGNARVESRIAVGEPVEATSLHARYADLVVVGQSDRGASVGVMTPESFPELLALTCGRPIVMVPFTGTVQAAGERVLIAWNASREATRAVTDALPMLQKAKQVTVVVVNPKPNDAHGQQPGADLSLYLARHGVVVEASVTHAPDIDIGSLLVSRVAELDADLLVMGCYGHSRLRELVLGGVTRSVLGQMTVPVLLSH